MDEDTKLDETPAVRGATIATAVKEECAWPVLKDHSIVIVWDKETDEMVAKIVPTFKHRKNGA